MNKYLKITFKLLFTTFGASCSILFLTPKNITTVPYISEAATEPKTSEQDKESDAGWEFNYDTNTLRIKNEASLFNYESIFYESKDDFTFYGKTPWWEKLIAEEHVKIEKLIIDEGIKLLPLAIFSNLTDLKEVKVPSTLTKLPNYIFYNCKSLEKIHIPDSVTCIGSEAFFNCNSLKEIKIGKGVKSIGKNTFGNCFSLKDIFLSSDNLYFSLKDGILYDKQISKLVLAPPKAVSNVTIPKTVTTIGTLAFANCKDLKQLRIPYNVKEISDGAFYNCINLKSISFAQNSKCKKISDYVEYNKKRDSFSKIYGAFENCKSLTSILFPESLETIGFFTLNNCSKLKNIYFGTNFQSLIYKDEPYLKFSYKGLKNLAAINVSSKNKTFISKNGIVFTKSIKKLLWYPQNKKNKTYKIPESVEVIEQSAFSNCKYLETIQWPKKLKVIGTHAFDSCKKLKSFTSYGNNVEIYGYAFSDCINLKSITLKSGTRYIGEHAFYNCSFQKVTIPYSVAIIGNWAFGYHLSSGSPKIKNFTIYCKKYSTGYLYAKGNKFKYKYF